LLLGRGIIFMKFLIITQKVDKEDAVLGFFHQWLEEFARQSEKLTVLCLYQGSYQLPPNVKVISLGKEEGNSRLKYLYRFYRAIWQERKNYDWVFVHMNQVYIILGSFFWRLWHKRIGLWYAHGTVSFSLRLAEKLTDLVITSTPSGFRLPSSKVRVVGQGINTDEFRPAYQKNPTEVFRLITVGRLSPVKGLDKMVKAVEILIKEGVMVELAIIGGAETFDQKEYLFSLEKIVREKHMENQVKFLGGLVHGEVISHLQQADLFVNMSGTGSLDKAILEAMACALPVKTCNEAVKNILPPELLESCFLEKKGGEELAQEIKKFINTPSDLKEKIGRDLRQVVVSRHNLTALVGKIIDVYGKN